MDVELGSTLPSPFLSQVAMSYHLFHKFIQHYLKLVKLFAPSTLI